MGLQGGADFAGDTGELLEVEIPVAFRRRADADQSDIADGEDFGQVGGGGQPAGLPSLIHQPGEARLVKRRLAIQNAAHLELVAVDADDGMSQVRKARGRHAADIAEAEDGDAFGSCQLGFHTAQYDMAVAE